MPARLGKTPHRVDMSSRRGPDVPRRRLLTLRSPQSFPNNLHQHPLASPSVEFSIEDLFPGAEVQFAFGNGHHDFAAHDLAFHVGIRIILSRAVVVVLGRWFMWCQLFQPHLIIVMQPALIVVNENGTCDVHRVYEYQAFLNIAPYHQTLNRVGDVHEATTIGNFEPQVFGEAFHAPVMPEQSPEQQPRIQKRRGGGETVACSVARAIKGIKNGGGSTTDATGEYRPNLCDRRGA